MELQADLAEAARCQTVIAGIIEALAGAAGWSPGATLTGAAWLHAQLGKSGLKFL